MGHMIPMMMGRQAALRRRGGGGVQFTVTTTGAQSVTFNELDVAVGETLTVNWGDGNSTDLTGEGTNVAHAYAGAGTWTVTFSDPTIITRFNCDDTKVGCDAGFIGSMVNLTFLYIINLTNVTVGAGEIGSLTSLTNLRLQAAPSVTVSSGEIGSLTSLTYLNFISMANVTIGAGEVGGLTSLTNLYLQGVPNATIGSGEIGSLTSLTILYLIDLANLTVGSGEIGALTSLTSLTLRDLVNVTLGVDEVATLTSMNTCILRNSDNIALQTDFPATIRTIQYENGLSEANITSVLAGIYADRAAFTWATPSLDIAGDGNAAPSGAYADEDPPTTGLGYVYELANDPELEGFNTWSITYEGGSAP